MDAARLERVGGVGDFGRDPRLRPMSRTGEAGTVARVVALASGGALLAMLIGILVDPRMSMNRYSVRAVAIGVLLSAVLFVGAATPLRWVARHVHRHVWDGVALALSLISAGLTWFIAYWGAYWTTWDPGVILRSSALSAWALTPGQIEYFSRYPNQDVLMAVARMVRGWGHAGWTDYHGGFAVIATATVLFTCVATWYVVRTLRGPAWACVAIALVGALMALSPWVSIPYTDALAWWTPITAVGLLVAARRSARAVSSVVLVAVAGIVLGAGYAAKVLPIVGTVAAILTYATSRREATEWASSLRGRAVLSVVLVVGTLIGAQATSAWADKQAGLPRLDRSVAQTPLVYVAQGIRIQTDRKTGEIVSWGGFDREITVRTMNRTTDEQNAYALSVIRSSIAERGLAGVLRFAWDKMLFNWGDGSFWARNEGYDLTAPMVRTGEQVELIRAFNAPEGSYWRAHITLAQIIWLCVLLAAAAGLVLRRRISPDVLLLVWTSLGIAAFVLVFQGRSRYLLCHVPVVIALAASVCPTPAWPAVRRRPPALLRWVESDSEAPSDTRTGPEPGRRGGNYRRPA